MDSSTRQDAIDTGIEQASGQPVDPGMDPGVIKPAMGTLGAGNPEPSVATADFQEVEEALSPVLTLRDGTVIPVPNVQAKRVISMFRLSANIMDKKQPAAQQLVDYADLLEQFADAVGDERLLELDIDEFMEVYGAFFVILVRQLGKAKMPTRASR